MQGSAPRPPQAPHCRPEAPTCPAYSPPSLRMPDVMMDTYVLAVYKPESNIQM